MVSWGNRNIWPSRNIAPVPMWTPAGNVVLPAITRTVWTNPYRKTGPTKTNPQDLFGSIFRIRSVSIRIRYRYKPVHLPNNTETKLKRIHISTGTNKISFRGIPRPIPEHNGTKRAYFSLCLAYPQAENIQKSRKLNRVVVQFTIVNTTHKRSLLVTQKNREVLRVAYRDQYQTQEWTP